MKPWRRTRSAAGAGALLLLALAACETLSACASAPSPTPAETGVNAPLMPLGQGAQSKACKTERLRVRVDRQPRGADEPVRALLIFTNAGANACSMTGWPTVALGDGTRRLKVSGLNLRDPRLIDLPAGRSAYAGLGWTPCSPGSNGCASGAPLLVAAPGSELVQAGLTGFSLPEQRRIGMRALVIGPIQTTAADALNQ